jgi:hypothetical protein
MRLVISIVNKPSRRCTFLSGKRYDAYLIYTHADRAFANKLARSLAVRKVENRALRVFYDKTEIAPGENFITRLNDALALSRFYLIVISPEMLKAEWPTREWTAAVYMDPSGEQGRVIPLLRRTCRLPPLLSVLNWVDFREDKSYDSQLNRLVDLIGGRLHVRPAIPPVVAESISQARPVLIGPDESREHLLSNLFPVIKYPETIWSAVSKYPTKGQIWPKIGYSERLSFMLKGDRLYTFTNLREDDSFNQAIEDDSVQEVPISSWLQDSTKNNWVIEALNAALRSYCWGLEISFDNDHKRFYYRVGDADQKFVQWHTGSGFSRRLAYKTYRDKGGRIRYVAHQAASMSFTFLGRTTICLSILPTWYFTEDGQKSVSKLRTTQLSTQFMHEEYNLQFLNRVRFWVYTLSKGYPDISILLSNAQPILVDIAPVTTDLDAGISQDVQPVQKMVGVFRRRTQEQRK